RRASVRYGRLARARFERGGLEENVAARRREPLLDVRRLRRDLRSDLARQKLLDAEASGRGEPPRAPRRHSRHAPLYAEPLAHLLALLDEQRDERACDVSEAEQAEVENFHVDFPHALRDACGSTEALGKLLPR